LLIGTIVTGSLPRDLDDPRAAAPGTNAKKSIEDGCLRRQGLRRSLPRSITGDTVGDPYKDTAGPAINPMIKIANIVRDPDHPR